MTASSTARKTRRTAAKKPANDERVESHNQAGGVTAHTVDGDPTPPATPQPVDPRQHQILTAQAQYLAQAHDAAVSKWIGAKVSNGDIPAAAAGEMFNREVGAVNQALQQIAAQGQQAG